MDSFFINADNSFFKLSIISQIQYVSLDKCCLRTGDILQLVGDIWYFQLHRGESLSLT